VSRDPEEIRADLEETRERMAETLEALGEKADVKARAKDRMSGAATMVKERLQPVMARVGGGEDDAGAASGGRSKGPILWVAGLAAGFILAMALPGGR
jgi:hypothetical protein